VIRLHTSPVLSLDGLVHGFPERTGGVSTGARASLNLGARWGDDRANVEANRRRLAEHAGYDPAQLVATRHVHGADVWVLGEPLADDATFDGLVADRDGPVLAAFAADCVPILFADPDARVIGAAHAGWRGTIAGVARNVIARMIERGARADRIRVALGPSIGPCCFEVGDEVVAAFRDALGDVPDLVVRGPREPRHDAASSSAEGGAARSKDHVDLRVATRAIVERAGVLPAHVDARPPCTKCEPDRFFSYRRDGQDGGVHMAFIGLR
jgi:YfiH family protein